MKRTIAAVMIAMLAFVMWSTYATIDQIVTDTLSGAIDADRAVNEGLVGVRVEAGKRVVESKAKAEIATDNVRAATAQLVSYIVMGVIGIVGLCLILVTSSYAVDYAGGKYFDSKERAILHVVTSEAYDDARGELTVKEQPLISDLVTPSRNYPKQVG